MVADPPEDRHIPFETEGELLTLFEPLFYVVPFGVIQADGDAVGQDFRTVHTFPPVEVGREGEFMFLGAHMNVELVACLTEDLRQTTAVPERVEVVRHHRRALEMFLEEPAAFRDVPYERLRAGEVGVGLDVPAAADAPTLLLHELPYPAEE